MQPLFPRHRQPGPAPAAEVPQQSAALRVYSTTWCGSCIRLKRQLDREGIAYDNVDIERDDDAATFVMSVNGGNRTVPTVQFPDGSTLSDPALRAVLERLATP